MSSHYNRREQGGSVVFEVVPAPYPSGSGMYGCAFVGGIGVTLISIPLVMIVVGIPILIAGVVVTYLAYRTRKGNLAKAAARSPVTITISDAELVAGGDRYALADLREILVGHASSGPTATQFVNLSSDAATIGHNARLRLEAKQQHVDYEVSVRTRGDSRLQRLVGGLTEQTASALVSDLREETSKRAA